MSPILFFDLYYTVNMSYKFFSPISLYISLYISLFPPCSPPTLSLHPSLLQCPPPHLPLPPSTAPPERGIRAVSGAPDDPPVDDGDTRSSGEFPPRERGIATLRQEGGRVQVQAAEDLVGGDGVQETVPSHRSDVPV